MSGSQEKQISPCWQNCGGCNIVVLRHVGGRECNLRVGRHKISLLICIWREISFGIALVFLQKLS